MIKIAVLADLHLPDHSGTVKEDAFEWALATAVRQQADVVLAIGDLTSIGTLSAAKRVREKLDSTNLPCLIVPGNAELRSPDVASSVLEILQTPTLFKKTGFQVIVLDTSKQHLTNEDRNLLKELAQGKVGEVLVATHFPLETLPLEDRTFLKELIERGVINVFVAGHRHFDAFERIGQGEYHLIRGIDPDKAIGGPPALTFFEYDSSHSHWQRLDYIPPDFCPSTWPPKSRLKFNELLGISCMHDSIGGINNAIGHKIRSIELRFENAKNISRQDLSSLIEQWRCQGGQCLSIHLPDIVWNPEKRVIEGGEQLQVACELALELGSNFLTFHPPRCPVGIINDDTGIRSQMLDVCTEILSPVVTEGIIVGIENLHMNRGETPDNQRGFGYTPPECLDWINALRKTTRSDLIGFHFDIGHARNNAPYSNLYNISQWFAELGGLITGYHLHQVERNEEKKLMNHRPITGMFGPLISFSSLFKAWRKGQIKHAPMYLEIRGDKTLESLNCFREYLSLK